MPDDTHVSAPVPDPTGELELIRSALGGEYELLGELGRGGMAVVYRAREMALDRDVAIKVLPPARATDAELVERLQREARLAAALEHPHIIPVYRVGQVDRVNFIVMKLVDGPSLGDLLRHSGALDPEDVERMLLEVAEALEHAHEHGVVHRDIKPDNIMRDRTGRYVVLDFGIARALRSSRLTQEGGSIGTPTYMSPEQARGGELDGRSDFYSLGVVAYECLRGAPPFVGDDPMAILYSHLRDPVPTPTVDHEHGRRVLRPVRSLLAKDPDARPHRARDLRSMLGSGPDPRTPAAGPEPATLGAELRRWIAARPRFLWVGGGLVAMLVVMSVAWDPAAARCRAALPGADEDARGVLFDPIGSVRSGAQLDLAYVVCGVPDDEPFTVELTIRPADGGGVIGDVRRFLGGGGGEVRVSWDEISDGFGTARRRTVTPGDLEPASYRATLRVRLRSAGDTERSVDFLVVEE